MHRAFLAAAAITWAIEPGWLTTILAIANREGPGPEAVAKELGRPLNNTRNVTMRGHVAVIPVVGPVFRRANLFSEVSGATSIEMLARDFAAALDNDDVEAIVLEIDSPGGEANGISEFADQVREGCSRKRVWAYVGGTGASAAYWIASACERIVLSDTAAVGSIGTVRCVPNPGAQRAADIEIVSSQSPKKRPNVRTEEGRAVYQAEVDALTDVFVDRVARHRGVSIDTVLEDFGQGACLIGRAAVEAGMADAVGSFESVIAELNPRKRPEGTQAVASTPNAAQKGPGKTNMSKKAALAVVTAATIGAIASSASAGPIAAAEDDDKDKEPKTEDGPTEPDGDEPKEPAFVVGDEVMVGERSAKVTEVRNGPHYAIEFDDDGSAFQWASEDELAATEGGEEAPEEEDDGSPAAARARALAAENRKLRAQLLGTQRAANKSGIEALVAQAKSDKKLTPALEKEVRNVARISLSAATALVSALPRIAPIASVRTAPAVRKESPSPAGSLTWNGKSYGEMSIAEKHTLATTDKDLFDQMRMAHEAAKTV